MDKRKKEKTSPSDKGVEDMGSVLYLEKQKKVFKPANILEMIMNPQMRKQTFDFYDDNYKETEAEKEIFEQSKLRRMRKDD